MRLIDADALYDAFERTPWMDNADRDIAEEVAENAPTVAEDNNVPVKQPDPITGLMPCGCGGVALDYDFDGEYHIKCAKCGIAAQGENKREMMDAWNLAMSGQTAEQKPVKTRNETPPKQGTEAGQNQQWVRTNDRMPTEKDGAWVLTDQKFTCSEGIRHALELTHIETLARQGSRFYTYWLPIPKLPEEAER